MNEAIPPDDLANSEEPQVESGSTGRTEGLIKWSTAFAVLCVAAVAAVVSYDHAYALVRAYGEDGWTAKFVPLTVDGLIFASSMVLLDSARRRLAVPWFAYGLLALGITATLAANAAHGLDHGPIGALVAAWPAVALVGSYELLMMLIRSTRPDRVSEPLSQTADTAARVSEDVSDIVPEPEYVPDPVLDGDPLGVQAVDAFAADVAAGRIPSIRKIRSRLRIGQPRAQHVRAHLSALVAEQNGGQP